MNNHEGPSPEEKARKEHHRLKTTREKYQRRVEQIEKQLSSHKETVEDLGAQMAMIEKDWPEVGQ